MLMKSIGKPITCLRDKVLTKFYHNYMHTGWCFVQTRPNTVVVFGQTNTTFGGTLSDVRPLFHTDVTDFNSSVST